MATQTHKYSLFNDIVKPHIYRIYPAARLANKGQFCQSFFHVPSVSFHNRTHKVECQKECLDTAVCEVGKREDNAQPKNVAAVVAMFSEEALWISSYTNCCSCFQDVKVHAEDLVIQDSSNSQEGCLGDFLKSEEAKDANTMIIYLTLQPCHRSAKNTPLKSCTEKLIKFYKEKLQPRCISLVVKPTFIYKAY